VKRLRVLAVLLAAAGLCALLPIGPWWFELPRHYLVQIAVCSWVAMVVFLLLRERRWAVPFLVLGIGQTWLVFAALQGPEHVEVRDGDLKLLSANVLTSNPDAQPLLDLVASEQPDFLLLLEVNQGWLQKLASLHAQFPHRLDHPRGDNFGISLWSRLPMDASAAWLGDEEIPSIVASIHGDQAFTLFAIHPLPPARKRMARSRDRQLNAIAERVLTTAGPVLVAGDANATPWSGPMFRFREQTGLRTARTSLIATWPTSAPPLGIQIDQVLVSEGLDVVSCTRGADIGSDHWPLVTSFRRSR